MGKHKTGPSATPISCYIEQGLVNISPMKMGLVGHISALADKFLRVHHQTVNCVSQQQLLLEEDDPVAFKDYQHRNNQGNRALKLCYSQYGN
jgi:hypothetical protein